MKIQLFFLLAVLLLSSYGQKKKKIPEDVKKGENLVREVLKGIELRDKKKMAELFDSKFVFETCDKKYNKDEAIKLVLSFDSQLAAIMEKNTQIVSVGSHKFIASMSNGVSPIKAMFLLSKDWKLLAGKKLSC